MAQIGSAQVKNSSNPALQDMSITQTKLQIVMKNGRPNAVILDIDKYEKLLEAVEEKEDLSELRKIKKGKISFKELRDYLKKGV